MQSKGSLKGPWMGAYKMGMVALGAGLAYWWVSERIHHQKIAGER
jgi:hypothetical protein